ncbi:F-actin-capping protein subunit beta [Microbotryomycetes sp. JL221]|nr:F-actin-capping protein subunit beta [Microbotryomycetes sp. JL221]
MADQDPIAASLDLFRRLPPHRIADNLQQLCQVLPEYADDLLGSVDQPLKVRTDQQGKQYLTCDYNRDGDSYRSPWTNEYDPPLADGTQPSDKLRPLEQSMNDAFDVYRDQYYEGGVSSVYLWDVDDGFAGVVLLKNTNDEDGSTASWDSIHVFESADRGRTANYKLTSTVMLYLNKRLQPNEEEGTKGKGDVALGGSMTRQCTEAVHLMLAKVEVSGTVDSTSAKTTIESHVCNVGRMIEDMELKIRNSLQEVYFSKTRDILLSHLRSSVGFGEQAKQRALQGELVGLLRRKAQA